MSERLRSVVEQLDIRPDDRVLEIGFGHGVTATFVCKLLDEGHLTAVDRSTKMIQVATRRNTAYVEDGRAELLVSTLEYLDLGDRRFDKVFVIRVGLFSERLPPLGPPRVEALVNNSAPGTRLLLYLSPKVLRSTGSRVRR